MVYAKRRPAMPRNSNFKPRSDSDEDGQSKIRGEDSTRSSTDSTELSNLPDASKKAGDQNNHTAAMPINDTFLKKGHGSGHNCPSKDSATTHPFCHRCYKKQHGGHCPSCNFVVSWKYGCGNHGWKGYELNATPQEILIGPEWDSENLEARFVERALPRG